jgi:hypothetical protein
MSSRLIFALAFGLAFAANARAQTPEPATPPASQVAAMPVVEATRTVFGIAPAAAAVRQPEETKPATPADGYIESERAAQDDMEIWFLRYGETLRRAE